MNTTPDPKAPVITWLAREETDYAIELSREDIADTFAGLEGYVNPDGETVKLVGRERILEMNDAEINVFILSLRDMTENGDWSWEKTANITMAFESLQESLYHRGEIAGALTSFHQIAPDGTIEFPTTMLDELETYGKFADDVADLLDHLERGEGTSGDGVAQTELIASLHEQITKLNKWRTD